MAQLPSQRRLSSFKNNQIIRTLGSYQYQRYGKGGLARRHVNNAYDLFVKSYGKDHYKTGLAMFWQAKINMGFQKHRRAAEKFEGVLDVYNKVLKPGDSRILQTHAFLVKTYEEFGQSDKATEHCIAVAKERSTEFDRELEPLYKVIPQYPINAFNRRKSGHVIAEFTVDEFGQVKDIKSIDGENVKLFEKKAHEALSKFRYAPSIKDGKRVKTEGVLHKVTFEME